MHCVSRSTSITVVLFVCAPVAAQVRPAAKSDDGKFRIAVPTAKSPQVEVTGLTAAQLRKLKTLTNEQWAKVFPVRVAASSESEDVPAILGGWSVKSDRVVFTPRFPFEPGLEYRAEFVPQQAFGPKADKALVRRFTIPKGKPARPPVVTQVYPSGAVLPENLLKFYVHFSVPMSRGEAYERITLHEAGGKQIPPPFLQLKEELWDRSGIRFTLYFEPGRIKRGLRPRAELGSALEEGKSYILRIDAKWSTASGHHLTKTFEKKFRVGPPDATQPDPNRWKITAPAADSRSPLTLTFGEPLDHAMLQRVLEVRTPSGKRIEGTVAVDRHEQRWRFTPQAAWKAGGYVVRVETTLEDRSGNSVGRAFETPETGSKKTAIPQSVELEFAVDAR
jgi:hypothetical protein